MKNIYSLNANQISSNDFILNVYYRDPNNGKVNYLPNTNVQGRKFIEVIQLITDSMEMETSQQNSDGMVRRIV